VVDRFVGPAAGAGSEQPDQGNAARLEECSNRSTATRKSSAAFVRSRRRATRQVTPAIWSARVSSNCWCSATSPTYLLFVKNPGWHAVFDTDAAMAETNRRKIMDRAIADKLMVTGYHYSMPGAGTFKRDGNGYVFVPVKA